MVEQSLVLKGSRIAEQNVEQTKNETLKPSITSDVRWAIRRSESRKKSEKSVASTDKRSCRERMQPSKPFRTIPYVHKFLRWPVIASRSAFQRVQLSACQQAVALRDLRWRELNFLHRLGVHRFHDEDVEPMGFLVSLREGAAVAWTKSITSQHQNVTIPLSGRRTARDIVYCSRHQIDRTTKTIWPFVGWKQSERKARKS